MRKFTGETFTKWVRGSNWNDKRTQRKVAEKWNRPFDIGRLCSPLMILLKSFSRADDSRARQLPNISGNLIRSPRRACVCYVCVSEISLLKDEDIMGAATKVQVGLKIDGKVGNVVFAIMRSMIQLNVKVIEGCHMVYERRTCFFFDWMKSLLLALKCLYFLVVEF